VNKSSLVRLSRGENGKSARPIPAATKPALYGRRSLRVSIATTAAISRSSSALSKLNLMANAPAGGTWILRAGRAYIEYSRSAWRARVWLEHAVLLPQGAEATEVGHRKRHAPLAPVDYPDVIPMILDAEARSNRCYKSPGRWNTGYGLCGNRKTPVTAAFHPRWLGSPNPVRTWNWLAAGASAGLL